MAPPRIIKLYRPSRRRQRRSTNDVKRSLVTSARNHRSSKVAPARRLIRVSKIRQSLSSATQTKVDRCNTGDGLEDETSERNLSRENLNSYKEFTPKPASRKESASSKDVHRSNTIDPDFNILNGHRSDNANQRDVTRQKKKRKRRGKYYDVFGCTCSPLCVVSSLLCSLLVGIALAALLVGLLTKSNTTTTVLITSTSAISTVKSSIFNVNLVENGDGETGPCDRNGTVVSPTDWFYNGTVTQVSYDCLVTAGQTNTTAGPSDRGLCYFYGQVSLSTTMWQTINVTNYVDSALIDSSAVQFNLSAWIGGFSNQDDNAVVSLLFGDQNNQMNSSGVSLGPVLSAARGYNSSLLFCQANGFVPVGTRFLTVLVTFNRLSGTYSNGAVDDINVFLYQ